MQEQGLDGENMYGCVLTKLPTWLVVIRMQPQNKKSCKQKSAVYCIYRCKHIASQKLPPELNDIMIRPVKIINYS